MAKIEIIGRNLSVEMLGLHKLWTLKSQLEIPLEHVKSIERFQLGSWKGGIRMGGTAVPGVIRAGRYREDGKWVFWDVCDMKKAVVVQLQEESYDTLIIETEDPDTTIDLVREGLATSVP